MSNKTIFLAANSADGFKSFFEDFHKSTNGWFNYIIKGGPGTGKSTAMKKVAEKLENKGVTVITGPCSSDPDSLDAVILPEQKIVVTDGTAPHIMEPNYVGATDKIVNFGDSFDFKKLQNDREKIIEISNSISKIYKRIYRYTAVLGSLYSDTEKLSEREIDRNSIIKDAEKFCDKNIPNVKGRGSGQRCFLSVLSHKGLVTCFDAVNNLADRVFAINDPFGSAADLFISEIIKRLRTSGYNHYIGFDPVLPTKARHIIIPDLKIAVITKNALFDYDFDSKKINLEKRYSQHTLSKNKEKIKFNRHLIEQVTEKTIDIMKEAKSEHDLLEKHYSPAVDFKRVNEIAENLFNDISSSL